MATETINLAQTAIDRFVSLGEVGVIDLTSEAGVDAGLEDLAARAEALDRLSSALVGVDEEFAASASESVAAITDETSSASASNEGTGFCAGEEQISTHTCNSTHPAAAIDAFGNIGVAWQDNRSGNYEIFFKALASRMSLGDAALGISGQALGERVVDLSCSGLLGNPESPGDVVVNPLSSLEQDQQDSDSAQGGVAFRGQNANLQANAISRTIILAAQTGTTPFSSPGVVVGSGVRLDSGVNAGVQLPITRIISPSIAELAFADNVASDSGVSFSVLSGGGVTSSSGEAKLTCTRTASLFPDVAADSKGRFHVVYQDDLIGTFQLYYVQVFPESVGQARCTEATAPVSVPGAAFGPVPDGTPGSIRLAIAGPTEDEALAALRRAVAGMQSFLDSLDAGRAEANRMGVDLSTGDAPTAQHLDHAVEIICTGTESSAYPSDCCASGVSPAIEHGDFAERLALLRAVADVEALSTASASEPAPIPPLTRDKAFGEGIISEEVYDKLAACAPEESEAESASFLITGEAGQLFVYGDRTLPDPAPNDSAGDPAFKTGRHVLFRDFTENGDDKWTGISEAEDRDAWELQTQGLGATSSSTSQVFDPPFVAGPSNPNAGEGDFGQRYEFRDVAFLAQTPPDADVSLRTVALPLRPRCAPRGVAAAGSGGALTPAPTRPLPPTFRDPVDISAILASPLATVDPAAPARYTIEGDSTGTVFTNVLVRDPRGELRRLLFRKDDQDSSGLKFILGQSRCGDDLCAVAGPEAAGAAVLPEDERAKTLLQIWVGDDYRADATAPASAAMPATLLFERTFSFGPGEATNVFRLEDGEVTLPAGRVVFFVARAVDGTEFVVRAVGGGNVVWSTDGDGSFDQYVVPWTLRPFEGLAAPVYYDGTLVPVPIAEPEPADLPEPGDECDCAGLDDDQITVNVNSPVVFDHGSSATTGAFFRAGADLPAGLYCISYVGGAQHGWCPNGPGFALYEQHIIDPAGNIKARLGAGPYHFTSTAQVEEHVRNNPRPGFSSLAFRHDGGPIGVVLPRNLKWVIPNTTCAPGVTWRLCAIDVPGVTDAADGDEPPGGGGVLGFSGAASDGGLSATSPLQLTISAGKNEHPRVDSDSRDNVWLVWHSDRSGAREVYVTRFSSCGIWNSPTNGGAEVRLTTFGAGGGEAAFPSVAVDRAGEAHIAFQGRTEPGAKPEIFYVRSVGGGASFTAPIQITNSPGEALMPDVYVSTSGGSERVVVAWHDNRFGNFEILVAQRINGVWRSSNQSGSDLRLTNADGDSMFARVAADKDGNFRVVWHDNRLGEDRSSIMMGTYVAMAGAWDSSGQGGQDVSVSNGPARSLFPDVAIDRTGSVFVAWQDDRLAQQDPDQHEEIFGTYCPRVGHPIPHFPPLVPNVEARLDFDFEIVDPVRLEPVSFATTPEVFLRVRAPSATFVRAANENGDFSDWVPFAPGVDLDTMVLPWTLSCDNGTRTVCVQIQDQLTVSFPLCREVSLATPTAQFRVEFFADESLAAGLPTFMGLPAAREGDVYLRITSTRPQVLTPVFDVISNGRYVIQNQETAVLTEASGASFSGAAGIGSFVGSVASGASGRGFSAAAGSVFVGRFPVRRHDGTFHVDGPARVIVRPRGLCLPAPR